MRRAFLAPILVVYSLCWFNIQTIEAFKTFGFDVHHRYSDTVKEFLTVDGLPEKGSIEYFTAVAHRDQVFKARHLAGVNTSSTNKDRLLTFVGGNTTFQLPRLGFLHYSIVTVGTPPLPFLVALDTGSDLFWLPCDCTTCVRTLNTTTGRQLDLNIYSPSSSSTSSPVPCNSTMCGPRRACSITRNSCAYQERYLSANTSTTGILVDDVLHLVTDANPQVDIDVPITLGCGIVQTGDFLDGAGINGLFGLGMDSDSVPSILASKGIVANSFSMCFGPNGIGRIDFGDKTSPGQKVTPFNIQQSQLTYNVTVTQVAVEGNLSNIVFTAIFDSGTSFTYLNDPAYTHITEAFDSKVKNQERYQPQNPIIFDYCYALSATQDAYYYPEVNLTMKGGDNFYVTDPTIVIPREEDGGYAFCLAVVKSNDINLIGQNFMTGYRVFFDREKMVLGWKESDCYGSSTKSSDNTNSTNTKPPINSTESPTPPPPPSAQQPEATPTNETVPPISSNIVPSPPLRPLSGNNGARLDFSTSGFLMVVMISVIVQHVIGILS